MPISLFIVLFLTGAATALQVTGRGMDYDYVDGAYTGLGLSQERHVAPQPQGKIVLNSLSGLSISKDWALRFDEELGRGDTITEHKKIELEDNKIRMAELLHFIPEGALSRGYEDHINNMLGHSNPYTHIVKDPYATVMLLEGPSASIANNDIGGDLDADKAHAPTKPPTPKAKVYAMSPLFAMHGI